MRARMLLLTAATSAVALLTPTTALATPVCTDGYMGGPPLSVCGGRVFPEAELTRDYIQYLPAPGSEFREWQHGIEYLAATYPRWVSVFTLRDHFANDFAVSMGTDQTRSFESGDTGDGHDIWVVRVTDHEVPDEGKETLLFSLSVHGDEKGGLEGGARAIEDLAVAAEQGGSIVDGIEGYPSATGIEPEFHSYEVADVLAGQAVYFVDFNPDGWVAGELTSDNTGPLYTRGNAGGTDLNRQMPTIGRIGSRIPLQESEMYWGNELMEEVALAGVGGQLAYGADIHGEGQSRAFADIMYPAGQFDSIRHRQLMSIAERTKSVIDATLYEGLVDAIEEATGGDTGEGIEDYGFPVPNTVPTKPARWGTVWDTLGYTDTGFIGDYLASQIGLTGMDYEIAFNHTDVRAYGRPWTTLVQENYINATRAIIFTAMAYAITVREEFDGFTIDPEGRVGYLANPDPTQGELFPERHDENQNNPDPVIVDPEGPFTATNQQFFVDLAEVTVGGLEPIAIGDIAADPNHLDRVDTLAIADIAFPADPDGRTVDRDAYVANLRSWVERGGNLVLTDRALHLLAEMGVVDEAAVRDIRVYQPYANIADYDHPMVAGLRGNARQLSEATLVGYEIGSTASPMTIVDTAAFTAAGGHVVGTTGNGSGSSDDGTQTSVGELPLGDGIVRVMGGGLPMPTTEVANHPYGLRDYSLTYSGLFIMENSIVHDAPDLGAQDEAAPTVTEDEGGALPLPATGGGLSLAGLGAFALARRLRRR